MERLRRAQPAAAALLPAKPQNRCVRARRDAEACVLW